MACRHAACGGKKGEAQTLAPMPCLHLNRSSFRRANRCLYCTHGRMQRLFLAKMTYDRASGTVIYRSKMHLGVVPGSAEFFLSLSRTAQSAARPLKVAGLIFLLSLTGTARSGTPLPCARFDLPLHGIKV